MRTNQTYNACDVMQCKQLPHISLQEIKFMLQFSEELRLKVSERMEQEIN
jgi:hypothetical protein